MAGGIDFQDKNLFLKLYDDGWKIGKIVSREPLRIKNIALVKSVTYANHKKLKGGDYFLELYQVNYFHNVPRFIGKVRKYDSATNIVEETEKDVVIKLKKFSEHEKPEDSLYVLHS